MIRSLLSGAAVCAILAFGFSAQAETRVTYKSAKSTSSYYQMAVQIAEAMKSGSSGDIIVTVEESQGSVQNVKEAGNRQGNYVFTTPPVLVKLAQGGKKMFEKDTADYGKIRSLFVIPSLTMHFVVSEDSAVSKFGDLDGKDFIIGKGSFGAREAAKYFGLFGLEGKVNLVDVELNSAVPALKNGQVHGFATAGSYPAPNVIEAAAGSKIRLLSLSDDQVAQTKRTRLVIPAGTYPGVDYDVTTTSLPVGAYTTTDMDDATAYALTKTYWEGKAKMGDANPWWNGVAPEMLSSMGAKLHPGALKYYSETGVQIADHLK
ncbi:TAXI family TRAP transporter solute-binding subunit [Pelagibius sp. Alg239-R121]|uniref:TAXI family TRAP transporter solute-binding subunit n=1 Tax=Pelagibius sp. Alg239-R121 TaxID=2993448 RepID=UPI0024A7954E|nr:TAXI family TRAP transporter solute-binding subunit [Pelagibius sp. Alg239-R121]